MNIAEDVDRLVQTWVELGMSRQAADEYGAHLRQTGRDIDAIIDVAAALRHRRLFHEAIATSEQISQRTSGSGCGMSAIRPYVELNIRPICGRSLVPKF